MLTYKTIFDNFEKPWYNRCSKKQITTLYIVIKRSLPMRIEESKDDYILEFIIDSANNPLSDISTPYYLVLETKPGKGKNGSGNKINWRTVMDNNNKKDNSEYKVEHILNPNYDPDAEIPTPRYLVVNTGIEDEDLTQGMTEEEAAKYWDNIMKDGNIPELW